MFEPPDDIVERAARQLRRPVDVDPALDGRVMREIATLAARARATPLHRAWRWLATPRAVTVTPLGALIAAAGFAAAILAVSLTMRRVSTPRIELRDLQFALVAPRAGKVALVGDFNDWDATRTPMRRSSATAMWTVIVPLAPGRYRYAYLVDDRRWLPDPAAPVARDDDYGTPSSVLTVGSVGS